MPAPGTRRALLRTAAAGLAGGLSSVSLAGCVSEPPASRSPTDTRSPTPTNGTESSGSPSPDESPSSPDGTGTPGDATHRIGRSHETDAGSVTVATPAPQESYYYLPYPDSVGVIAEPDTQFLTVQVEATGTTPARSSFSLVVDGEFYHARNEVADGVPVFELGRLTDGLEDAYAGEEQPTGYLVFGVPTALEASSVAVRWAREHGGEVRWTLADDQVAALNDPPRFALRAWTHVEGDDGPVLVARVAHEGGRLEPFRAVTAPEDGSHWFDLPVSFEAAGTVGAARQPATELVGWPGNHVSGPEATFVLDRTVDSWATDVPWPESTGTETPG